MSGFNPDDDTPIDLPPPPVAAPAAAAAASDKPASKELPPTPGAKKALPSTPGAAADKKTEAKALPATPADKKSAPATGAAAAPAPAAAPAADEKQFIGYCLCKKIKVTVSGLPQFSGFCHCTICSKHGGTDRGLVAGWNKAKVTIDGKEDMGSYKSSDRAVRNFCKTCGTGICNESDAFTAVSPAIFSDGDKFRVPIELAPTTHIFYGSSCLLGAIKDGSALPLFKDTPKQMGGSGDIIKE